MAAKARLRRLSNRAMHPAATRLATRGCAQGSEPSASAHRLEGQRASPRPRAPFQRASPKSQSESAATPPWIEASRPRSPPWEPLVHRLRELLFLQLGQLSERLAPHP